MRIPALEALYRYRRRIEMLFLTEAVFHLKNLTKETMSLVAWKTGARLGWLVLGLKKILENQFLMPSEEKKHLLLQVQES